MSNSGGAQVLNRQKASQRYRNLGHSNISQNQQSPGAAANEIICVKIFERSI